MKIPVVYVAGPFSAATTWDIAENVRAAERIGLEIARAGCMPLIPHANTHLFHGQGPYARFSEDPEMLALQARRNHEFWLEGTLELMRRCDAAVFASNWRQSKGACAEMLEAQRLGLPLYVCGEAMDTWLHDLRLRLAREPHATGQLCGAMRHIAREGGVSPTETCYLPYQHAGACVFQTLAPLEPKR